MAVYGLLAAGRTPADVQRRLGKSKGYVSVPGYLGAALAGVEPEDLARLRHPALTPRAVWSLVTRARTDERASLRETLGTVTTDAAGEAARRRARDRATVQLRSALRAHVQAAAAGLAAPPRARGGRRPRSAVPNGSGGLAFDPAAWAADPVAAARAHLAALAAAHGAVLAAAHGAVLEVALRAARTAAAERVLGPQFAALPDGRVRPLGRLTPARWRALADAARAGRTAAEDHALALLTRAARALRPLLEAASEARPVVGTGLRYGGPPSQPNAEDTDLGWADVDADLAE